MPREVDTPPNAQKTIIVHAVHGTWPYGFWAHLMPKLHRKAGGEPEPWFIAGSSFHQVLTNLVGRPLGWMPFEWSGTNSFAARGLAARALSQHLTDWFAQAPEAEHVIIAHSHGGSVAVEAARILDATDKNHLTKIICLATPFAYRSFKEGNIRQLIARYLTLRFGWIPISMFVLLIYAPSDPSLPFGLMYPACMVCFVFPILFLLWRIGFVKFAINRRDPPVVFKIQSVQKWSLHAIRAPQDEATIAINTAQFISFVSEFLFVRALLVPFDWIRLRLTPVSRTKRILLWLVVSVLSFPITQVFTRELIPALVIGVIAAPILIAEAIAILVTYITLLGAVILIPANVVLAVALGADLMRDQGLMMIECEPIPSGIIGTVATIRISEDERNQLGLVHFIHATYAARQRAAEILGGTSFGG